MYYALIMLSVVMFGGVFALNDVYREERGSSLKISMQFSLIGGIAGLAVLLPISGFVMSLTPFSFVIALLSVINGFAFTFCSFKALGSINLSLYSLFSMLGGMLLPFLQGILFYSEKFTVEKVICLVFICSALLLTLKKDGEQKRVAKIYYTLVFILNGMSGVLSKLFASAPEQWKITSSGKTVSSADYSVLTAVLSVCISALLLVTVFRKRGDEKPLSRKSVAVSALSGSVNRIANWILVFALANGVDSSVQYPMVTGGTMIVSTLICYFGKRKPDRREVVSVVLSFIGLLALFLIPIII